MFPKTGRRERGNGFRKVGVSMMRMKFQIGTGSERSRRRGSIRKYQLYDISFCLTSRISSSDKPILFKY